MRALIAASVIGFAVILAGCGGGGGGSTTTTTPVTPSTPAPFTGDLNGTWQVAASSSAGGSAGIVLFLTLSNGNVTGTAHAYGNTCFTYSVPITVTGSLSGSQLALTATGSSQNINITATLSGDATATVTGTYTASGGCVGSDKGNLSGFKVASYTGSWSGTIQPSSGAAVTLSATLNQSRIDSNAGIAYIDGSATATNSPCLSSLSINALAAGTSIGANLFGSGASVDVKAQLSQNGNSISGTYSMPAVGSCAAQSGTISLTRGTSSVPVVSVSVSPSSAQVAAGATQQFTATVQGSTNTAVTWQVNGVTGGNAVFGTVSGTGQYTAPASPPLESISIVAISQADTTKTAPATVTATFGNASLSGSYVFSDSVADAFGFAFSAGTFQADGNGHLTNGVEDENGSAGPVRNVAFTGTYSIGPDGRGKATLTSAFGTSTFAFVLTSSAKGQFIEFDNQAVVSGYILRQDPTALSSLSGPFVFFLQGNDSGPVPAATVGRIVSDGAGHLSGTEDLNDNGQIFSQMALTGTYTIANQGRGQAVISGTLGTSNLNFYIVDSQTVEFMGMDSTGIRGSGAAYAQPSISYTNASLTSSAFLLSGYIPTGFSSYAGAGRFDASGGNISNGIIDELALGAFVGNTSFTGTYSIVSNGRGTATVNDQSGSTQYIFWMSGTRLALFLEADAQSVAAGVAFSQTGTPFSTSTMQGNFGYRLFGYSGTQRFDSLGQVVANGNGALTGTEDLNQGGTLASALAFSGTYTLGSNGRGSASTGGPGLTTTPLILYAINPYQVIFLSAEGSQVLVGTAERQCSDCIP